MAKGKAAAKSLFIKRLTKQKHIINVAFFILAILVIQNLGQPASNHKISTMLGLGLQVENKHTDEPKPEPIKAPGIAQMDIPLVMAWRGPVEPIAAPPNVAPVFYKVPTNDPVVFVGIDDGVTRSPEALKWLSQHHLPFSMFLYNGVAKEDYGYFAKLKDAGLPVEDHTINHPAMIKLNLDQQRAEICTAADTYAAIYGRRPTLFRPPYGLFNDLTRQAAADCGMRAIVMWHATVEHGAIHFQDNLTHLEPGDIVLMHFRPELLQDLQAFTKQVQQDNLQVARLEDWLK